MVSGTVIPITPTSCITVDYWGSAPNVLAAFCTHAHRDHLQGLSDTWTGAPIFCSDATKELLIQRWPDLSKRVFALDLGEYNAMTLPTPSGTVSLNVILLNANHCLGAVMFLFEGPFGRILHTGDFRWEADFLADMLQHPALTCAAIDTLFLDNTYAHPRYEFPTRLQSCGEIIRLVQAFPQHAIVIAVDTLGKEELLAAVAAALREHIWLPPERFAAVKMLGLPLHLFTTDTSAARIHATMRHQMSLKYLAKLNRRRPTVAILPSAYCSFTSRPTGQFDAACAERDLAAPETGAVTPAEIELAAKLTFKVPYSLHCSHTELRGFVSALRPRQMVCTVSTNIEAEHSTDACAHFADLVPTASACSALPIDPRREAGLLDSRTAPLAPPLAMTPDAFCSVAASTSRPTALEHMKCQQEGLYSSVTTVFACSSDPAKTGVQRDPSCWRHLLSTAAAKLSTSRMSV